MQRQTERPLFRHLTDATSRGDRKATDLGSASPRSNRSEAGMLDKGMEEGKGEKTKENSPVCQGWHLSRSSEYGRRETGRMFSVFHYFIHGKNLP